MSGAKIRSQHAGACGLDGRHGFFNVFLWDLQVNVEANNAHLSVLAILRDSAHTMPDSQIRRVMGRNYGKGWEKRFEHFDFEPITAASIAVSIVSLSRISPTRMTSGSWRSAARNAPE